MTFHKYLAISSALAVMAFSIDGASAQSCTPKSGGVLATQIGNRGANVFDDALYQQITPTTTGAERLALFQTTLTDLKRLANYVRDAACVGSDTVRKGTTCSNSDLAALGIDIRQALFVKLPMETTVWGGAQALASASPDQVRPIAQAIWDRLDAERAAIEYCSSVAKKMPR